MSRGGLRTGIKHDRLAGCLAGGHVRAHERGLYQHNQDSPRSLSTQSFHSLAGSQPQFKHKYGNSGKPELTHVRGRLADRLHRQ
jgi:hypothetical protein